jgi:DNA-binding NtrC family response regulator
MDDIPLLVEHFLEEASKNFNKRKPAVPSELNTLLSTYHFPGNIRELKSMIYDAVGSHQTKVMSLKTFKKHINPKNDAVIRSKEPEQGDKVIFGEKLPTLREVQNALVFEALKRTDNNQSIAADMLGVTRQAINRRILNDKKSG